MLERIAALEHWLAQQDLLLIARLSHLSRSSTIPAIAQWIEREQWCPEDEDETFPPPRNQDERSANGGNDN